MKTAAGLTLPHAKVPNVDTLSAQVRANGRQTARGSGRRLRRIVQGGIAALALSLLPACDSLWRPYVDTVVCDPSGTRCIDPGPGRVRLLPSNGIEPAWFGEAQVELAEAQDLIIDTDQGTIVTANDKLPLPDVVYHQIAPVDCGGGWMVGIGVFSFLQIQIPEGIRVRVKGSRALALIAPGPIQIEGVIDLRGGSADCGDLRCAGPGGFAGSWSGMPAQRGEGPGAGAVGYGVNGPGDEAGGGGGAACGLGGKGGDSGPTFPGGGGGTPYLAPTLIPLCGGSGGGAGGRGASMGDPGQRGGGGGGAIQIVSQTSVTLSSSAATPSGIQAGGGGGEGDRGVNFNDGGGGGGGGGAILIEAPRISVGNGAVLAVNGGGGAGGYNSGAICTDGLPAALSVVPAAGGAGICTGGAGGAGATPQGADAAGMIRDGGGGGGGGAGRIRLNSLDGTVNIAGELSPQPGDCNTTGLITLP